MASAPYGNMSGGSTPNAGGKVLLLNISEAWQPQSAATLREPKSLFCLKSCLLSRLRQAWMFLPSSDTICRFFRAGGDNSPAHRLLKFGSSGILEKGDDADTTAEPAEESRKASKAAR